MLIYKCLVAIAIMPTVSLRLYVSLTRSKVADMKNSVKNRDNAQPSCAGLFINAHLGFDFPGTWLHIDMANPSAEGIVLINTKIINFLKMFLF